MINKDFCLSSYIAFRYIYDDNIHFYDGMNNKNYILPKNPKLVSTSNDIDFEIKQQIDELYKKYNSIGILLSGGMDSAIVSSYLKNGSHAYTFTSDNSDVYNLDIDRAKYYCKKNGLIHHLVSINFEDYKNFTKIVMENKGAPVHSIEPQIYKAALEAKKDGVEIMLIGDAADYIFGGMDKLLSKDWDYEEFKDRYILLKPEDVLTNPIDISGIFKKYKHGKKIDFLSFLSGPTTVESYGSYYNAFLSANMPYYDPYENLKMNGKLDLERIRKGESKYLIRELYSKKYPDIPIPEKIPMPRPVDIIFSNWDGPRRKEFKNEIAMEKLTGNQKWQLWCAEEFLNIYEPIITKKLNSNNPNI